MLPVNRPKPREPPAPPPVDAATRPSAAVHVRSRKRIRCYVNAAARDCEQSAPLAPSVVSALGVISDSMTSRARKIIDEALSLPKEELVDVVAKLQQQVEATDSQGDIDAAWQDEIVRRVRAIKSGSAALLTADEVDRELAEVLEER